MFVTHAYIYTNSVPKRLVEKRLTIFHKIRHSIADTTDRLTFYFVSFVYYLPQNTCRINFKELNIYLFYREVLFF